jgi:hypothetical protein
MNALRLVPRACARSPALSLARARSLSLLLAFSLSLSLSLSLSPPSPPPPRGSCVERDDAPEETPQERMDSPLCTGMRLRLYSCKAHLIKVYIMCSLLIEFVLYGFIKPPAHTHTHTHTPFAAYCTLAVSCWYVPAVFGLECVLYRTPIPWYRHMCLVGLIAELATHYNTLQHISNTLATHWIDGRVARRVYTEENTFYRPCL